MLVLGLDTSNYATSLAVLDSEQMRLICDVKRFLPVREGQLGLRQSDAVFIIRRRCRSFWKKSVHRWICAPSALLVSPDVPVR